MVLKHTHEILVDRTIRKQRKLIRRVILIDLILISVLFVPFIQTWFGFLMIIMLMFGANMELLTLYQFIVLNHNSDSNWWKNLWIYWTKEYHLLTIGSNPTTDVYDFVMKLNGSGFIICHQSTYTLVLRNVRDAVQVKLMR